MALFREAPGPGIRELSRQPISRSKTRDEWGGYGSRVRKEPVPVYDAHDAVARALPGSYGSGTRSGVHLMPIFMIERRFAADIEASAEAADMLNRINEQEGVRWLYSFLSADKRKTYCLYEAPFADAIRRAATRAGIPADAIVEVSARLLPDGSVTGSPIE
jgi:Protein of unknown function (DUF4242)